MPAVESSAIAAIDYDPASRQLYITFNRSGTYTYYEVPAAKYDAFLRAPSKGQFFHAQIRDQHSVN